MKRYQESLSPDDKVQILTNDAAAHKKQQESLSPEQKVKVMTINAAAHKNNMSCFPWRKKQDAWKLGLNNVMNF